MKNNLKMKVFKKKKIVYKMRMKKVIVQTKNINNFGKEKKNVQTHHLFNCQTNN